MATMLKISVNRLNMDTHSLSCHHTAATQAFSSRAGGVFISAAGT